MCLRIELVKLQHKIMVHTISKLKGSFEIVCTIILKNIKFENHRSQKKKVLSRTPISMSMMGRNEWSLKI